MRYKRILTLLLLAGLLIATHSHPISASGNPRIVFTSDRTGDEDVFIMNGDGSAQTNLTNNPSKDYFAQWASDDQILFISDRSGTNQIYKVPSTGGEAIALTSDQTRHNFGLFVSPDSRRLLALNGSSSSPPGVLEDAKFTMIEIASGEASNLPDTLLSPLLGGWGWMPDSQNILISTPDNLQDLELDPQTPITTSLHVYNVETGEQSSPISILNSANDVRVKIFPIPSQDGQSALYLGTDTSIYDEGVDSYSLYSTRLDGTGSLKLSDDDAFGRASISEDNYSFAGNGFSFASLPAWSADSSRILFTPASATSGRYDALIVENQDSATPADLGPIISEGGYMSWYGSGLLSSGSSSKLILSTNDDGNFEIYTLNDDGSGRVNLTNHPGNDNLGFASVETTEEYSPEQPTKPPQTGRVLGAGIVSFSIIAIVVIMAKEIKSKHHSWGSSK